MNESEIRNALVGRVVDEVEVHNSYRADELDVCQAVRLTLGGGATVTFDADHGAILVTHAPSTLQNALDSIDAAKAALEPAEEVLRAADSPLAREVNFCLVRLAAIEDKLCLPREEGE